MSNTGRTIIEIIVVVFLVYIAWKRPGKKTASKSARETKDENEELKIEGAYQKRWFFSYNEKEAYNKLKTIAEELGYTVFAKVRILDLLEPVKGNQKYSTYLNKIKSKHVDFVLCDKKLVARYIIELDDSSHNSNERKERDDFVDKVVESVGYKIIHVKAITNDIKSQLT